jgi:hypothetical protein
MSDTFDVVVYGGTPAGITASVAAARAGARVLMLEQSRHVGGLSTSGLNTSEREHMLDISFTGLAGEFYRRVGKYYGFDLPLFRWESHAAETVFNEMLGEAGVTVRFDQWLDRVEKRGGAIRQIRLTDGATIEARAFVDATYEGDLMARAGVSCTHGRESRQQYGEPQAGMRFVESLDELRGAKDTRKIDTPVDASPCDERGNLLPGFITMEEFHAGAADRKVMCYNYRVTVSRAADRVPITAPPGYDPEHFILLSRWLASQPGLTLRDILDFYAHPSGRYRPDQPFRHQSVHGDKWELNNKQAAIISLGHFGGQFQYPDADYEKRRAIIADHRHHNQGLLYFLGHDPSVPKPLRDEMLQWGLAADEYTDNDHWPYYLYIREARRMLGAYVMTQHDLLTDRDKPDSIAIGSHWIDSHHVQRVALSKTRFRNEGRIWVPLFEPFAIPYRSLTPGAEDCINLLVPVCVSATHVAFCSVRLESTWMCLGHVAGAAAATAAQTGQAVQELDVPALRKTLREAGMVVDLPKTA